MSRLKCAGILGIIGIILAIVSFVNGQLVTALALFIAAGYVCLGVIIGITTASESPVFKVIASLVGIAGIIGVFIYSPGLNPQIANAHVSALDAFIYIDLYCPHPSTELREIKSFGLKACTLQNNSDRKASVVDLAKALHLGPVSSLADSAISLSSTPPKNYCAIAFKAAEKICPAAFSSLSSADRETLTNLANNP